MTNKNCTQDRDDLELEQLRQESFEFYEAKISSLIEEMPRLAEALAVIRKEELFRLAGHSDFYEYVRARFAVPPQFAAILEEFFGEEYDSTIGEQF